MSSIRLLNDSKCSPGFFTFKQLPSLEKIALKTMKNIGQPRVINTIYIYNNCIYM